ncbi:MAG: hypothetical protein U0031_22895 [Thermomicrobiales bacterium]
MSRSQLVDAYVAGSIDRRAFVHGLTALGISAGVAASYAVALQPAAAKKGGGKGHGNQQNCDDYYSDYYGRPETKADCKNGGYAKYGFKNQGRCIACVNRLTRGKGKGKGKGKGE